MTIDSQSKVKVGVSLNLRNSNLKSHIRWFQYLASDQYVLDLKKRSQSSTVQRGLVSIARQVVEEDIYSISKGAGKIGKSFKVVPQEGGIGNILYSDPSVAPSKAGKNPGAFSYAAFFERPEMNGGWKSFIKSPSGDEHDRIRYRPFFEHMATLVRHYTIENARPIMMHVVQHKMPSRQK